MQDGTWPTPSHVAELEGTVSTVTTALADETAAAAADVAASGADDVDDATSTTDGATGDVDGHVDHGVRDDATAMAFHFVFSLA